MYTLSFAIRLRYALPLAQMTVAVLLRWGDYLWFKRIAGLYDMPPQPPAWQLSTAINMPIVLIRALWTRMGVWGWWDEGLYIAVVGLFWYWIAMNMQSWRQQRAVRTFSNPPLRVTADLLLIMLGIVFGGVVAFHDPADPALRYSIVAHHWLWFVTITGLHLVWSLTFLFFFGRDLISVLRNNLGGHSSVAQKENRY
jgi:hypothetical protein